MFHPTCDVHLGGSTVIVPSVSVGNVPQMAMDLFIFTHKPEFIGYISHDLLIPIVGARSDEENPMQLSAPCEVYFQAANKLIFLQMRAVIDSESEKKFSQDLVNWMVSIGAKKVITLISMEAVFRANRVLQGSQFRYAVSTNLQGELVDKVTDYGWSKYDLSNSDDSKEVAASSGNNRLSVPSGGFGQHLYDIGNQCGLPSLAVMMFAYEGDNERDARALAEAVNSLLCLEVTQWKKPSAWGLAYGNGPPAGVY